jgi:four helix bundle protein
MIRRNNDLIQRTKEFGMRVAKMVDQLPTKSLAARTIGGQVIRSALSVGANYRAACRARSAREFIAKLGIVEEECDESAYWIECIIECGFIRKQRLEDLLDEANQITAIIVASIRTARRNTRK